MAFKAGDAASRLIPFATGGDAAVFACATGSGDTVEAAAFDPLKGFEGVGVAGFPAGDGRDERVPFMLSITWRC